MQHHKKSNIVFSIFVISLLTNCALSYFLIDNAITSHYLEMDIVRYQREKKDSIQYLNLAIKNDKDFNFASVNAHFLKQSDSLFKPTEDGYVVLGALCFKKTQEIYNVSYCSDVFN